MNDAILSTVDLKTHFPVSKGVLLQRGVGVVKAVDGVSITVGRHEILGLVGESGCGKSTFARTIIGLERASAGEVWFENQRLDTLPERDFRKLRPRIQMVFQDPYASLNPRRTVYDTLAEPMRTHGLAARSELPQRVSALMEQVGLARKLMRKYPHEFSGGQRQRIAVARALALEPMLILADEPVSALDVSVQAQILNLLAALQKEMGLSMLLISHDLSVVKHMSQRIAVMYLGKVVEEGPSQDVFEHPSHPYTDALIAAIPEPVPAKAGTHDPVLKGDPPSPLNPPKGCPFHPRCPVATEACRQEVPAMVNVGAGHTAACLLLEKKKAAADA